MTDHTDALCGITQADLDECDPAFSSRRCAWLTIGRMHGVVLSIGERFGTPRRIPQLVRDGVVLRFPIPRGADLDELAIGLGAGGDLSALIDAVLDGHLLTLAAEAAAGRLSDAAALARDELLDALALLGRFEATGADRPRVTAGVWPMQNPAAASP